MTIENISSRVNFEQTKEVKLNILQTDVEGGCSLFRLMFSESFNQNTSITIINLRIPNFYDIERLLVCSKLIRFLKYL